MHFLLGLLFGYYIRGKESSLVATLVIIALVCFIDRRTAQLKARVRGYQRT